MNDGPRITGRLVFAVFLAALAWFTAKTCGAPWPWAVAFGIAFPFACFFVGYLQAGGSGGIPGCGYFPSVLSFLFFDE